MKNQPVGLEAVMNRPQSSRHLQDALLNLRSEGLPSPHGAPLLPASHSPVSCLTTLNSPQWQVEEHLGTSLRKYIFSTFLFSPCHCSIMWLQLVTPWLICIKINKTLSFVHLNWLEVLVNYHFLSAWRSDCFLLFHSAVNPLIRGDGKWIIKHVPFS